MAKTTDGRKNNGNKGHSTKSKRAGRPKLEVCEEDIYRMAQTGLTDDEICHILEISISTLNNFRSVIKKGRSNLSRSIKRTQLDVALNERDKTMLIWVGKQYAGQREKSEQESYNKDEIVNVVYYADDPPKKWDKDAK